MKAPVWIVLAIALILLTGCSFALVRAPSKKIDPATMRPEQIHCNDSGIVPAIDALGGAAAIFADGAGIILEHTSEKDRYDHFTLYYAAPILAVAIVYFYSASFGNDRISKCDELKETAGRIQPVVRPIGDIDGEQPKVKPRDEDIEIH